MILTLLWFGIICVIGLFLLILPILLDDDIMHTNNKFNGYSFNGQHYDNYHDALDAYKKLKITNY